MAQFKVVYNYRTVDAAGLEKLRADLDTPEQQAAAQDVAFEITEENGVRKYKRRSFDAMLDAPAFLEGLPALAIAAVQDLISKFVRATYVDRFLPVGQHDWEYIEKELATTGGRQPKFDISEETWALASDSFKRYMLEALGATPSASQASARLAEVMKAKFSKNAITKHINEFNESIIGKLQSRVVAWATWAAENETDNAADFADVFSMVNARLDGFTKSLGEAKIDFAAVL